MTDITTKAKELRAKLVVQASDSVDMGDYKKQILAYQHIINNQILLFIELSEEVDALKATVLDLTTKLSALGEPALATPKESLS